MNQYFTLSPVGCCVVRDLSVTVSFTLILLGRALLVYIIAGQGLQKLELITHFLIEFAIIIIIVNKSGNVLPSETKPFRCLNLATSVSLFKTGHDGIYILSFVIQFI